MDQTGGGIILEGRQRAKSDRSWDIGQVIGQGRLVSSMAAVPGLRLAATWRGVTLTGDDGCPWRRR